MSVRPIDDATRRSEVAAPRRGWLVIAGAIVLVTGVVGAIVAWLASEQRYDDGVMGLARAPVGCESVLAFTAPGDFLVFAESAGQFDPVEGDCTASGSFRADVPQPSAQVEVVAPDGSSLTTRPATGVDYDRAGSRGSQIGAVTVSSEGDHLVRVISTDGQFAVAIGQDPLDGVVEMRVLAVAVAIVGLVAGVVLIAFGNRPRGGEAVPPPGEPISEPVPWWETSAPPTGPPGGRPVTRPDPPIVRPGVPPVPARIPGQPVGPGWRVPDGPSSPQHSPERSPWAPPTGDGQ